MTAAPAPRTGPPAIPTVIPRPRLFAALERPAPLTLLSAPAGFGKTTLLAAWLAQAGIPSVWLTMEPGDSGAARFRALLLVALPALAVGADSTGADPHAWALAVAGALDEILQPAGSRIAIVLDDYHNVADPDTHATVDALIDHLPPGAGLFIATRSEPPLAIARLRARAALVELRATDLRFTPEEVARFFSNCCQIELSAQEAGVLAGKTEGWAAGLRLAAAFMKGAAQRKHFIARFSGTNRHVADYLGDEVLRLQTEEMQEFLLSTSILRRLCAGLCNAVTGRTDGQAMLESLEAANLFLAPLDDERRWYRYHGLFADMLRARLARSPLDPAELHRRAAAWWEAAGAEDEAVRHRLAAREFEKAAALIDRVAEQVMQGGRETTFLGWVDALPDAARSDHPSLDVYHDVALAVAKAAGDEGTSGNPLVDGGRQAARAFSEYKRGRLEACVPLAESALTLLPQDRSWLRGSTALLLASVRMYLGELELAARDLGLLLPSARRDGNVATATACLQRLFIADAARGRWARAREHCEQALGFAFDGAPAFSLRTAFWFLCALTRIHILAGDAEECGRSLERARSVGAEAGLASVAWLDELDATHMLLRGDREGAVARAARAERLVVATHGHSPEAKEEARRCAALSLLCGDIEAARAWEALQDFAAAVKDLREGRGFSVGPYLVLSRDLALFARIELGEGRPREALGIAELLVPEASARGDAEGELDAHILRALALDALGGPAREAVEAALDLARDTGYVGALLLEGERMAALLYGACTEGPRAAFAGSVLARFPAGDAARACREAPGALVEPLSAREIEILRLLAAGLSNREIADRVFVSEKTVKWHASNIYAKLGVTRRTQAVARARILRILAPGSAD